MYIFPVVESVHLPPSLGEVFILCKVLWICSKIYSSHEITDKHARRSNFAKEPGLFQDSFTLNQRPPMWTSIHYSQCVIEVKENNGVFDLTHDSNAHVHEKFTAIALSEKFRPHFTQVLLTGESLREESEYPIHQRIEVRCKVNLLKMNEKIGYIVT